MYMEKYVYYGMLFDIYQKLLNERNREVFELYYDENLTLQEIADNHHSTKNGIAVAFILTMPAKMQVVLGSMTPSRLTEMIDGRDVQLSHQEWYDIYFAAGNDLP